MLRCPERDIDGCQGRRAEQSIRTTSGLGAYPQETRHKPNKKTKRRIISLSEVLHRGGVSRSKPSVLVTQPRKDGVMWCHSIAPGRFGVVQQHCPGPLWYYATPVIAPAGELQFARPSRRPRHRTLWGTAYTLRSAQKLAVIPAPSARPRRCRQVRRQGSGVWLPLRLYPSPLPRPLVRFAF